MVRPRQVLVLLLCALLGTFAVAVPADAASTVVGGITIKGRIYDAWKAAGGTSALGTPAGAEVSATVGGHKGYLQRFAKGQVFSSALGSRSFTYPGMLKLSGVHNERDALAPSGFTPGVLLRSARLHQATTLDKLELATELRHGTIIDLRTASAVTSAPDPKLPSVTRVSIGINSDADYPKYVTSSTRRTAFATALRTAAASKGAVLIHCTAGKDRTGWTIAMIMYAIGASTSQVRTEYARTDGAKLAALNSGLAQVTRSYGSIRTYLSKGLGLTSSDLAKLRAKFR